MEYKKNCGFRKIKCCNFKVEDCRPKPENQNNIELENYCDLYNIEWNSKAVKKEIDELKKKLKKGTKDKITIKKLKKMLKLEKANKMDNDVIEYKKQIYKLEDYGKGLEILNKAYRYLKRTKK